VRPDQGAPLPADIEEARRLLAPLLDPTPLIRSAGFSRLTGRDVRLKAESLQVTGSFKVRGAYNRISRLTSRRGVIAASAGNHAQGVALAATRLGIRSTIVMPVETPLVKVDRTRLHGGEVILHGDSFEDSLRRARELCEQRHLTFVHAYEDRDVMAGQGTIGLEILERFPDVQAILVPVGGGGLISGIAIAVKSIDPKVKVIGVQARGADPAVRSFRGGRLASLRSADTIADAIRFKQASAVTMPILRAHVDAMVDVTEEEISEAIVRLLEESRLVAEGAGAVGLAALLAGRVPKRLSRVCAVISGGNIDLNMMARVVEQGLSRSNRYLVLRSQIPDKPGRLHGILAHLVARHINVLDIRHNRAGWRIPLGCVEVELLVETRNAGHAAEIIRSLNKAGYQVQRAERG
jgi:threonine dehydratase